MYAVDSGGNAKRDTYENGRLGVADIRARKARAGDTELADAVRCMAVRCQIMIEYDHLSGDQRDRGERCDQRPGGSSFFEYIHDRAGEIYPTATAATTYTGEMKNSGNQYA